MVMTYLEVNQQYMIWFSDVVFLDQISIVGGGGGGQLIGSTLVCQTADSSLISAIGWNTLRLTLIAVSSCALSALYFCCTHSQAY